MFILALADVGETARRGYPEKLKIEEFTRLNPAEADTVLVKAAKALGITPKPGEWLLCSSL